MLKSYLGDVVLTATHLINRLPFKVLNFKSPMEVLSSFYPNMKTTNHLIPKIFGYVSFMQIHSPNRGKLDPRAVKYIFVGYYSTQKGYKCCYLPSIFFFVSTEVTFNESESYFPAPHLQGRIPSRKTKIRIPISLILLISFSLTLLKSLVQYLYPLPLNLPLNPSLNLSLNLSHHPQCLLRIE